MEQTQRAQRRAGLDRANPRQSGMTWDAVGYHGRGGLDRRDRETQKHSPRRRGDAENSQGQKIRGH